MSDIAVQGTNADAAISKLSCVNAGYFEDEFLPIFVRTPVKRNPIINKGYHVRVQLMRRVISRFIDLFHEPYVSCQIVVLGAGLDTNSLLEIKTRSNSVKFFEIDFSDAILHKSRVISAHHSEFNFLGKPEDYALTYSADGDVAWCSPSLKLIGHDLRSGTEILEAKLALAGFDKTKPTLFLAECVLIYLEISEGDRIMDWVNTSAVSAGVPSIFALYEQVNPRDPFGRMMIENMIARGCPLRGIVDSPVSLMDRFGRLGFVASRSELITHFDSLIKRKSPEIIDELEEYNLLQTHYAFTLGSRGDTRSVAYMSAVFDSNDNTIIK